MEKTDVTKRIALYTFLTVGIVVSLVFAFVFAKKGSKEIVLSTLSYNEQANEEYRVYYQDNDFYTNAYYDSKTNNYLGSLINTIDIDFDYYLYYSKQIKGSYDTSITGELIVYEPNNESNVYWTKEYKLDDVEPVTFESKDYRIQKTVNIPYQDYLDEYNNYSKVSKLSTNAKFVVKLNINNKGTVNSLPDIDFNTVETINIPLTEAAFKITKKSTTTNDTHTINNTTTNTDDKVFTTIVVVLCISLALVFAISIYAVYKNDEKKTSVYERTLKKILTAYNNIIVSVKTLPETKELNAINVTSFDELVDAQSEVRLPINFKEDAKKKTAKFILIRNDMAWIYTLKEGDLEDEKKA